MALVIFLTLGVLIMVTHQCLNTSLLRGGWCCIWGYIYTSVTSDSVSEHLNEELHSRTLRRLCVIKCKMTNNLVHNFWLWKLYLKFISHLLWTDFVKYNFVLDWHVHWYVCTAVWYVLISFIVVSLYWNVTVFGLPLPVILSQLLPYGLAPNIIFFVSYSAEKNVVVIWKIATEDFYFLTCKMRLQYQNMHLIFFLLTDPFCPPQQMTCYRSLCLHSCLGTTSM